MSIQQKQGTSERIFPVFCFVILDTKGRIEMNT